MTMLAEARDYLRSELPKFSGVTLDAERVGQDRAHTTCTITTAVLGRTVYASNQLLGPRVEFGELDFLIPPADYKLGAGGTAVEPEEGDRFTWLQNGEMVTHQCFPVAGEPAHRMSDGGLTFWRVHCKRITDERGE
jgi:hypothetical protein